MGELLSNVLRCCAGGDGSPAFYRRVRSRMTAKRIVDYLKTADYEVLKNKSKHFTWPGHGNEEIDGPTLLWLLLQMCNSSTRVGVAELKEDLLKATSAKFQHNVSLVSSDNTVPQPHQFLSISQLL